MNSIKIELRENNGQFAAYSIWGMSTWHRDPVAAISELFGKALPLAVELAVSRTEAYQGSENDE